MALVLDDEDIERESFDGIGRIGSLSDVVKKLHLDDKKRHRKDFKVKILIACIAILISGIIIYLLFHYFSSSHGREDFQSELFNNQTEIIKHIQNFNKTIEDMKIENQRLKEELEKLTDEKTQQDKIIFKFNRRNKTYKK